MKFPLTLLACLFLTPFSLAAPRVGTHPGFTRLVFDLPGAAAYSTQVTQQGVKVKLNTKLRAEQGTLNAPGVSAYAVAGNTVSVTLTGQPKGIKTNVLAAAGRQGARLTIDVPHSGKTPSSKSAVPASPARLETTPRAVTETASSGKSKRLRVIIDPGHGGVDPGMQSQWVSEEEVTLDVGLRVRDILQAHGVTVTMTRSRDTQLSTDKASDLNKRSEMATTGAVAAYISIHVNAGGPEAQGIETYFFGQPIAGTNRTLAVTENGGGNVGENLTRKAANTAQNMLGDILAQAKISFSRQLAQKVQSSLLASTGAVNRGVHTDAFYVIRSPKTAAILTEIGFGSSPREGQLLATPAYRAKIASGIAQAILSFLNAK